ncbi:MAG: phosphoenolpyruvate--protein phosphotransferase [Spartobacteria bacterium]|nr:phosphoenolpyruvate--protein phosphotransferase [Spartobacteria bacterium]
MSAADTVTPQTIAIKAPLSGPVVSLDNVPDPVFAQKMVGDGVSIDPLSQVLLAPCDGEVVHIHPANHAVTLRIASDLELMLHIGVDSVQLKGKGFTLKVREGAQVKTGDELIAFDSDYIATHAKSLLTQIILTEMDRIESFKVHHGRMSAGSSLLMEIIPKANTGARAVADGQTVTSDAILIPNPTGLHARPAAVLANIAKKFTAEIKIKCNDRIGNAKSVTGIMKINIKQGDKVVFMATGSDAEDAIGEIAPLVRNGLGDEGCAPAPAPATTTVSENAAPAPQVKNDNPDVLRGVAASPGLAIGHVYQVRHEEIHVEENGGDVDDERDALRTAIQKAKGQLEALQARLHADADAGKAAIFAAHEELLGDPDLMDIAKSAIAKGKSAPFAWKKAYTMHAQELAGMDNELLAARANDVRDVGDRVLKLLTGIETDKPAYPSDAILVAEDLSPSDTAMLDRARVMGFCTTRGGATSHVAILARSLGIPAVAGIDPKVLDLANDTPVILNGTKGNLRLNPTEAQISAMRTLQKKIEEKRKADLAVCHEPAVTLDGHRVEVVANIGNLKDARGVAEMGGEGVGLLRSEFLFMGRATAPNEEEQKQAYSDIASAVGKDKTLVIRTLDVGGDKPLSYIPIPREDNPFLGERGIRIGLDRPEILRTQLRAILGAAGHGKLHVMFPMISTIPEWRDAKAIFLEECKRLNLPPIPVGMMMEVPSAAVMAAQFAAEVDFFSIGTNDLTQYTLAMDRGHPKLAPKVDGMNPAVLQLIYQTVEAAHAQKKWVGVCGGLASEEQAAPILIGLGVDELSVSIPSIPTIKALVRGLRLEECRALAKKALACNTAEEVRALVPRAMEAELDDLSK